MRELPTFYPPPATIEVVRHWARQNAIDVRFAWLDRHLTRWACSHRDSYYPRLARSSLYREQSRAGALPPLPDNEAVAVDQLVCGLPFNWPTLTHAWYRGAASVEQIGERLGGLSRSRVYEERRLLLAFMLAQCLAEGLEVPRVSE